MKKTKAKEKTFNIKFLNQDISKDRKVSHHRLKSEILNASTFEPLFTKNEIIQIGKAYGLTLSRSLKKSVMVENLAEKLESMQNMPYPEKLRKSPAAETSTDTPSTSTGGTTDTSSTSTGGTTDTPSTSTGGTTDTPSTSTAAPKGKKATTKRKGRGKRKGEGKRKKKGETDLERCGICRRAEEENEEWINCDNCETWFHRNCVEICDELWEMYIMEDEPFICAECN